MLKCGVLLQRCVFRHGDCLKLELTPFSVQFKPPKIFIASVICDILEGGDSVAEAVACYRKIQSELAQDKNFRDERVE